MYGTCAFVMTAAILTALKVPGFYYYSLAAFAVAVLMYRKDISSIARDLLKTLKSKLGKKQEG